MSTTKVDPCMLQVLKSALVAQCPVELCQVVERSAGSGRDLLTIDEVRLAIARLEEAPEIVSKLYLCLAQLFDQAA